MGESSTPRLWIKLTLPGVGQVGPGKIQLLRQIDRESSIAGAARRMGMSYRRAWLLTNDLNRMFARPVVETRVGGNSRGGARLTSFGLELVETYELALEKSNQACAELLADLARDTQASRRR